MPARTELPPLLVIDASVGVKWVVDEVDSDRAASLIAGRQLVVPGLFWVEAANALAAKLRRSELGRAQAQDAWYDLSQAPLATRPATPESISPALSLAQDLGHPVYDCVYLALALAENCQMVTADKRFAEIVRIQPSLAERVILLSDIVVDRNI